LKELVILLLFAPGLLLANTSHRLPSGEVVEIMGVQHQYAGGSKDWVLTLRYLTDDISDMEKLCERAEYLWPILKPEVEKKGWSYASVKASKPKNTSSSPLVTKTEYIEYSVGWIKSAEGKWNYINDICPSNENRASLYLELEQALMSNDVETLDQRLLDGAEFSVTLQIFERKPQTQMSSKRKLLKALDPDKNSDPVHRSRINEVGVRFIDKDNFCTTSTFIAETIIGGEEVEEKEVRSVCFIKQKNKYKAKSINIGMYYKKI